MEDKYSRVSGKDILNAAAKELDKKQIGTINDDNVYMFDDGYEYSFEVINVESVEELRNYVVNRINTINSYDGDFLKEKSLISIFKEIYRFYTNPDLEDYEQDLIEEIKDYNSVYPPDKADEIAYLDIINKNKRR